MYGAVEDLEALCVRKMKIVNDHRFKADSKTRARNRQSAASFSRRGLGDSHYADVNRRQREYDKYLEDKERKLNRRSRRVAQDQANDQ